MNIQPIGNQVLIKKSEPEKVTPGGIVIPDKAQEKRGLTTGKILVCGNGKIADHGQRITMQVKVGQMAVFDPYHGATVPGYDEELVLIDADCILAVLA